MPIRKTAVIFNLSLKILATGSENLVLRLRIFLPIPALAVVKIIKGSKKWAFVPIFLLTVQYEGGRDGFTYEKEADRWKCPNNKYLTFKKIKPDPKGNCFRHYRTCRMDCRDCPLKQQCIGKQHECQLRVTIYKDYYERAIKRVKCSFGRRMKYLRQSTVEPVLGSLINYYAMIKC